MQALSFDSLLTCDNFSSPPSFLPFVGMVTILMNDYPKLKVRMASSIRIEFNSLPSPSPLQYVLLGGLGVFVLLHRE